jgi:cytochrome P450
MRFQPLLREPYRICAEDYTLGEGTAGAKRIARGTRVLPITRSAMLDPRHVERPRAFDPDRPAHHFMLFGHGLHRCIGAAIAEAQITHTFKPLLQQRNLRRAAGASGKLSRSGPFPRHLHVEFERDDQPRADRAPEAEVA